MNKRNIFILVLICISVFLIVDSSSFKNIDKTEKPQTPEYSEYEIRLIPEWNVKNETVSVRFSNLPNLPRSGEKYSVHSMKLYVIMPIYVHENITTDDTFKLNKGNYRIEVQENNGRNYTYYSHFVINDVSSVEMSLTGKDLYELKLEITQYV